MRGFWATMREAPKADWLAERTDKGPWAIGMPIIANAELAPDTGPSCTRHPEQDNAMKGLGGSNPLCYTSQAGSCPAPRDPVQPHHFTELALQSSALGF